jgi:RHS repeat-associated protein
MQGRFVHFHNRLGDDCGPSSGTPLWEGGGKYASPVGNSFGFGAERSVDQAGTGLSYFRNRWYDARTGRFTQEDPIGYSGGANLYAYAGNSPATYTDPFGLAPDTTFVGCRPVGGTNTSSEGQNTIGHCAVRVVDEERDIDTTFELSPEPGADWINNSIYVVGGDNARVAAYGDSWVAVGVPEGMSVEEFDDAVLRSAFKEALMYNGKPYFPSGNLNSNSFVYETVTRAGGFVPAAAAGLFKIAPGICGGSGAAKGRNCK